MRSRLPLIAAALLLAGIVTFLILRNIEGYKRQLRRQFSVMAQGLEPVQVIVATQDINKRGTVITEEMIKLEKVPGKAVQPYAVQDPTEVVGKEPLGPIAQGQQILRNQLVTPGTAVGSLSAKIPSEKRAISVEIDMLTGVSGFIRPGDHVDILWTFGVPGPDGKAQPVTLTLFQNVEVLAVGAQMHPGSSGAEGEQQTREARTITLALQPHEAELLLFAQQQGHFQMSLRPRSDVGNVTLPPATMDALLQQVLPQARTEAPHPATPAKQIEIIRGKTKEVMSVTPTGAVMPVMPNQPPATSGEEASNAKANTTGH